MKVYLAAVLAASMLLGWSGSASAWTLESYREFIADPMTPTSMLLIGQTIMLTSSVVEEESGHKLYCPPPNLSITGEQYQSILDKHIEEMPGLPADIPVEFLMVKALQATFPC